MKEYEHRLKELIELAKGGIISVSCTDAGISERAIRYLSARGLVEKHPAGDNEFNAVVTPKGLTYFDDKRLARKQRWIDRIVGFISGIAAAALGGLIVQLIQG